MWARVRTGPPNRAVAAGQVAVVTAAAARVAVLRAVALKAVVGEMEGVGVAEEARVEVPKVAVEAAVAKAVGLSEAVVAATARVALGGEAVGVEKEAWAAVAQMVAKKVDQKVQRRLGHQQAGSSAPLALHRSWRRAETRLGRCH